MKQLVLPKMKTEVTREVNGLEMGVLSDGTAYFTQRSLSKLCGIANSSISKVSSDWIAGQRASKLARWLLEQQFDRPSLYVETDRPGVNGNVVYAYQDDISTLILEFYALEMNSPEALKSYRLMGRAGLRLFVYHALGYDPRATVPPGWRQFYDRVVLVSSPEGYFSVFKEIQEFVVCAMKNGLPVNETSVPDGSVGQTWALHWEATDLEVRFGARIRHEHNYPDYFPQAASNPQPMWVYPIAALGEFRLWLQKTYVTQKFPAYLKRKTAKGALPESTAKAIILAATPPPPKALPAAR